MIKLIRKGCTRNVLLIGKFAFKFPTFTEWRLFLHGMLANINEARWWKCTRDSRLCPTIWACPGGFLNIMVRAVETTHSEWLSERHTWAQIMAGLPLDNKAASFGKIKESLVILDYGS